ncbi:EI24 domain-containing protein [Qipengyuania sp. MTN3-11]|uniref:EI24 domain-containing protein n=1 Tax=Qipengyuania sp. MTN3-11 TaxID=3056557 RepID=UPI0036F2C335
MMSLPRALALSFGQLGDPAILRVLAKTVLVTLAIFLGAGAALWWGLDAAIERWILALLPGDYSGGLAGILALALAIVAGWLLFRLVALAVLQFFAEDVVRAVEKRHYPGEAASARALPFAESLGHSAGATLRAVIANAAALPVAALLAPTAIGAPLVFWLVNSVLLGRELQDMVWLRHRRDKSDAPPVGAATRFVLGGLVAAMLAVPFVNFLAPVLGAAAATHLVHRRMQSETF